MINIKKNYTISIKLLIFLILLISCSSKEKDRTSVVLKDTQIYKTGLTKLKKKEFIKIEKI